MPLQRTINRLQRKSLERAQERTQELQDIVVELHASAPRGGSYLNAFKQPRSAPGEQPAVEYGTLMSRLQEPIQRDGNGFTTIVNYMRLEFGSPTENVAPRPMGDMAIAQLKRAVDDGAS